MGISWSLSFAISITSAFLQTRGKVPLTSEPLIMRVIGCEIIGRQSFPIREEILSRPGALFEGIDAITSSTCLHWTGLKENCQGILAWGKV